MALLITDRRGRKDSIAKAANGVGESEQTSAPASESVFSSIIAVRTKPKMDRIFGYSWLAVPCYPRGRVSERMHGSSSQGAD